ncbi:MAG: carboxypeptidase regulatory-like domain-containing protein [Deltaproteobacteria bacterium]|nr:MAG: carboxypeptidase regulatory-like domain-containing protein [Deltaproteobacteria bacterium]
MMLKTKRTLLFLWLAIFSLLPFASSVDSHDSDLQSTKGIKSIKRQKVNSCPGAKGYIKIEKETIQSDRDNRIHLQVEPTKAKKKLQIQREPTKAKKVLRLKEELTKEKKVLQIRGDSTKAKKVLRLQGEPTKTDGFLWIQREPIMTIESLQIQNDPSKAMNILPQKNELIGNNESFNNIKNINSEDPYVTGRIVDEYGYPIPYPFVIFIDPYTLGEYYATSYFNGTFEIYLPYTGDYYVTIWGLNCMAQYCATIHYDCNVGDVLVDTHPNMTGRVVDEGGFPISNALVTFISDYGIRYQTSTYSGGWFETADLPYCGEYYVIVRAEGCEQYYTAEIYGSGPFANDFVFNTTPHITGWVVDEYGFPISDLVVYFISYTGNKYYATTNSDGTFGITLPYCGDYYLVVGENGGCELCTTIDIYGSGTFCGGIVLDTDPDVTGRLVDENNSPISNAEVIFIDSAGSQYPDTTNSGGWFELTLPHCGEYDVIVRAWGCEYAYTADVYGSGSSAEDVVFDTTPDVTGRVVDESGFAIPNPMVIFVDPDTWIEYPATSYPDGSFEVTLPYCREYYIFIEGEGCNYYIEATVYSSGSYGDITFNTQPTVTGTVVDQDYVSFSTGIVEFISCNNPGIIFSGNIVNGDFTVNLGACDGYEIFITVPCGTFQLLMGDGETCFDIISDTNLSLIVIQCPPPPSAPTGLMAEPGPLSGEITIFWDESPDPDIDGYIIYRGTVSGLYTKNWFVLPSAYAGYTFLDLEIGQTYYFVVSAVDLDVGESEPSDEASATAIEVGDSEPPTDPSNLTINDPGTGERLDLSWLPSTDDVAVSHYLIYRLTNGSNVSDQNYDSGFPLERGGTDFTDYEVWEGNTYYYVVYAVDTSGNISGPSNVESDEPTDSIAPDPPYGLDAFAGDGEVDLWWIAPDSNENGSWLTDLAGYNVYRRQEGGVYDFPINFSEYPSYQDSGLINGETYYYVVTAVDDYDPWNESYFSDEVSATPVTVNPPPPPPTNVSIIEQPASIIIQWDGPSISDLSGFNIYRRINGSYGSVPLNPILIPAEYEQFYDTNPDPVLENCYVVRSVDTINQESGNSNEVCGFVGDGVLWTVSPTELDPAIISFYGPVAPSVNIIYYLFGDYLDLFDEGVQIKLEIFNTGGPSVYTEWDDNPRGSVDGYNPIFVWNGKNTDDLPVPEGYYDVKVSLYYNGAEILWNRQYEAIIVAGVKILEPNEVPVTDNNFVFNNTAHPNAIVEIIGTAMSGIAEEDSNLIWSISNFDSRAPVSGVPIPPQGYNFTYKTLPLSNNAFVNQNVFLNVEYPGCSECKDTQKVEIFFPRDETNHPGADSGLSRNWFYYWKEGGVVPDLKDKNFEYLNQGGFGGYDRYNDILYVLNDAPTTDEWDIYLINQYYQTCITSSTDGIANTTATEDDIQVIYPGFGKPHAIAVTAGPNGILDTTPTPDDHIDGNTITTGADGICNTTKSGDDDQLIDEGNGEPHSIIITAGPDSFMHSGKYLGGDDWVKAPLQFPYKIKSSGIDCCAVTCTHELEHQKNYYNGGRNPTFDSDDDGVADIYEGIAPYYLDPTKQDSYDIEHTIHPDYADVGDDEFLARMAEKSPGLIYPNKDWSDTNGKQWEK